MGKGLIMGQPKARAAATKILQARQQGAYGKKGPLAKAVAARAPALRAARGGTAVSPSRYEKTMEHYLNGGSRVPPFWLEED